MAEVWAEMQAQVEELTGQAGLQILRAILENEVTRRVEPPHRPIPQQAVCSGESSRVTWSSVDRRSRWNDREYEPLRARKEGEKAGGAIVFAPPANNSHLISPHTRMYLTIGITMLASLVLFCVVIFRRDSAVNFIESHPLPILVLVSLASILRL